jgi:hypothetical protein
MADTSVHGKVERWIVANELPRFCREQFSKGRVPLTWGGLFEYDAVSSDSRTVAVFHKLSSHCHRRSSHRQISYAEGGCALSATHVWDTSQDFAFTDRGMLDHFDMERARGRFPPQSMIEVLLVDLPRDLAEQLRLGTSVASSEVSPRSRD